MWMAGYAARTKPSEGTAQDLFAKALALEDAGQNRLVIVTMDLIGVPRPLREAVERRVGELHALPRHSLLINASHTHCGPELRATKYSLLELNETRASQGQQYLRGLEDKLVALVGEALGKLAPARLSYCHARAGFAMNRRTPAGGQYRNFPNPEGPVDHAVPVLKVETAEARGQLLAVLFGYACHNTTLSFYQFCGDYAGYAQQYLEEAHPDTVALFMTGCGGDQNPYPRGKLELAQQHGRALANGVEAALQTNATPLAGPLRTALEEVTLQFAPPPTKEQLLRDRESPDRNERRHAELLLKQIEEQGAIRDTYSYPIHVVRFGEHLLLVALAGETVVDYSLRLKRELAGPAVWVAGYSNDVFGYVPSLRVLKEGGYEAGGAMRFSSLPGPFAPSVEERIVNKVHELAKSVALKEDADMLQAPDPDRKAMLNELAPIIATRVAARDTRHVVFHGCIDWHSAVHGHWALLRIARTTGQHKEQAEFVNRSLSPEGVAQEAALLRSNATFEMPYGRAWFLLLAEEFERWADENKIADPKRLRSMAGEVAASLRRYLGDRPPDPQIGEYRNPCWALLRLHGWYTFVGDNQGVAYVERLVAAMTAPEGFGTDVAGREFFSRLGNYATLLCAVRPTALADLLKKRPIKPEDLLPVTPQPRADHGLGLNWSRAWALKALTQHAIEAADQDRFREAYAAHVAAAWKDHVKKAGDIRAYDHWVPQFAVYALTQ
jgi:hypothetical protein